MARPFFRGTIHRLRGWRWLVFWPLAWLLRAYYATLRFRVDPADLAVGTRADRPLLFVVWHNRSLIMPALARRFRQPGRISCLVSPSRMAAWEDAFYEFCGLRTVRGSSSRRSIAATREMVAAHHAGQDLALAPDGPSGPLYDFKRGAVMLARVTGAPLLFVTASSRWAVRLPTWDRHFVPLPFAVVRPRCVYLESVADLGDLDDRALAEQLRARFLAATVD